MKILRTFGRHPGLVGYLLVGLLAAWMSLTHAMAASPEMPVASFDCGKAPGVDERIICSDRLLRQADHEIGVAYRSALAASTDAAHVASMKTDEHSWIIDRNNDCQITKYTVVTDQTRPGYVDCLFDEYAERLADLEKMKRHPEIDPTTISHPIRRSFIGHHVTPSSPPKDVVFAVVDTLADDSQIPLLGWKPDGTLLILDAGKGGDGLLYTWRPESLKLLAHMRGPAQFSHICALDDGTILFVPNGTADVGTVNQAGVSGSIPQATLPPKLAHQCGVDGTAITAGDAHQTHINVGPQISVGSPIPSYVTVGNDSGDHIVSPPIRIDSRFHLRAAYSAFLDRFVVSAADRPAEMQGNVERRWSKTNCLAWWAVSAASATATSACIPLGPYVTSVPEPLPSRGGLFFSVGEEGLYRVVAGSAQPVLTGTIEQPVVSPDGCYLAFMLAQGTGVVASKGNSVVVLTACTGKPPG